MARELDQMALRSPFLMILWFSDWGRTFLSSVVMYFSASPCVTENKEVVLQMLSSDGRWILFPCQCLISQRNYSPNLSLQTGNKRWWFQDSKFTEGKQLLWGISFATSYKIHLTREYRCSSWLALYFESFHFKLCQACALVYKVWLYFKYRTFFDTDFFMVVDSWLQGKPVIIVWGKVHSANT